MINKGEKGIMSHSGNSKKNGRNKDHIPPTPLNEGKESFENARKLCANNPEATRWLDTHRSLYQGPVTATTKAVNYD